MRIRAFAPALSVAASAIVAAAVPAAAQISLDRITVATGPAGTLYSQLGTALSTVYQEQTGLTSTARPHGGTSQYLPQLSRGEVDLGINSGLDANAAFAGNEPYPEAMENVRAVLVISNAPYGFIARADSDIQTVEDVAGHRVITGYRTLALFDDVNRAVLATGGLTLDDVESVVETNVPQAVQALAEDDVDVTASILGIPVHREVDAGISGGTRVVALGDNEQPIEDLPAFFAGTLEPSDATVGVEEPTRVAFYNSYLNTGTHMSEDDVYELARIAHQNWDDMQQAVPALRGTPADNMVPEEISHPFHPGAIRYFREAGLWTDEHDAQQEELLGQ